MSWRMRWKMTTWMWRRKGTCRGLERRHEEEVGTGLVGGRRMEQSQGAGTL
jgi:hypothetical protein